MENEHAVSFAVLHDNGSWEEEQFVVPASECWNEEDCEAYVRNTYMYLAGYRRVIQMFLFDELPEME